MPGIRGCIGWYLRKYADRIDRPGAPKAMHVSFTFEERAGIVFRDDGKGCRLWYYGDDDYERAHAESGPVTGGSSTVWLPQPPARPGSVIFLTVQADHATFGRHDPGESE
jgi:hypothetical protein